jgi:hypothetical protein
MASWRGKNIHDWDPRPAIECEEFCCQSSNGRVERSRGLLAAYSASDNSRDVNAGAGGVFQWSSPPSAEVAASPGSGESAGIIQWRKSTLSHRARGQLRDLFWLLRDSFSGMKREHYLFNSVVCAGIHLHPIPS